MIATVVLALSVLQDPGVEPCYVVEDLPIPTELVPEIGGIDFAQDGSLWVVSRRGMVWKVDVDTLKWSLFAEGLHECTGVLAGADPHEVIIADRPSITRVVDTDHDGVADFYEVITEDFGVSGNYHEYTFTPVRDAAGHLFFGLGCASNGAGIFKIVRGPFEPLGRPGRMYSCVPYRGWILERTPDGQTLPFASGFREPNGLGFDLDGNLFVTDNQGDWLGTSKMFHVERGNFYGHVSSLVWDPSFEGDPLKAPIEELERRRTRACILFPHGKLANSPTQLLVDSSQGKFGPFAGQFFTGCINLRRTLRIALEEVNGEFQGAVFPFLDGPPLRTGNNRLAWSPDGTSLYLGQGSRAWAGGEGLQRIRWTGQPPMSLHHVGLREQGFDLHFTAPVDPASASDPTGYAVKHYYYHYHRPYGSPVVGLTSAPVAAVELLEGDTVVRLTLPPMVQHRVYEITMPDLQAADGRPLDHDTAYYTLNQLRQ